MRNKAEAGFIVSMSDEKEKDNKKKVIAHDVVKVRDARGGDSPPMIVTLPKEIVKIMNLKSGEKLRIYTDGENIYLNRFEETTI